MRASLLHPPFGVLWAYVTGVPRWGIYDLDSGSLRHYWYGRGLEPHPVCRGNRLGLRPGTVLHGLREPVGGLGRRASPRLYADKTNYKQFVFDMQDIQNNWVARMGHFVLYRSAQLRTMNG